MTQGDLSSIRYRSRRGMLELDLILLPFVDHCYGQLSDSDKAQYLELLETPDPMLYAWLIGAAVPEDAAHQHLVEKIRVCRQEHLGAGAD